MKILKSKKGFTLIELVVALVLIVMIAGALALLVTPAFNVYAAGLDLSQAQHIAADVTEEISGELAFASDVSLSESDGSGAYLKVRYLNSKYGVMTIENTDGILGVMAGGVNIAYDKKYYMGKSISVRFERLEGDVLSLTVAVFAKNGDQILQTTNAVRLLNAYL